MSRHELLILLNQTTSLLKCKIEEWSGKGLRSRCEATVRLLLQRRINQELLKKPGLRSWSTHISGRFSSKILTKQMVKTTNRTGNGELTIYFTFKRILENYWQKWREIKYLNFASSSFSALPINVFQMWKTLSHLLFYEDIDKKGNKENILKIDRNTKKQ